MFSDEDLQRYLRNEAPQDLASQIEAALGQDRDLEDRLMALDDLAPVLKAGLDLLPAASIDVSGLIPKDAALPPVRSGFGWMRMAAGFAAGAVLAGGLVWLQQPGAASTGWRAAVAEYQALYAPHTVAMLDHTAQELKSQMAHAEAQIGASGLYEVVKDIEDLTLLRVQTLAFEGRPLVQMVFATPEGEPVALCAMKAPEGSTPKPADAQLRKGLASMAFDTDDHHWILIGTDDEELIADAGREVQTRLERAS
ncbi:MAG: hypothetical protein OIF47_13465 [Marinibacterium sp.]|nr:hypothetical protein [Marinibacterium sp.]